MTCSLKVTAIAVMMAAVVSAVDLTNEERERFLREGKVVATKQLSQGITGSLKVTLDDGAMKHAAHVQTIDEYKARFEGTRGTEINFRDSYKYNVAAYELAKMLHLNMVPPSVARRVNGKSGAVTWWVDNVAMTEGERRKRNLEAPDQDFWNRQSHIVRAFDELIFNTDRNLGNLVITEDWQIWMIDHTRAFRWRTDCPNVKSLKQIDRNLLENMRKLDRETMRKRLGGYLSNPEIDGVLARRDKIVKHFDEQLAAQGEGKVLYEIARR